MHSKEMSSNNRASCPDEFSDYDNDDEDLYESMPDLVSEDIEEDDDDDDVAKELSNEEIEEIANDNANANANDNANANANDNDNDNANANANANDNANANANANDEIVNAALINNEDEEFDIAEPVPYVYYDSNNNLVQYIEQ